MKLFKIIITIFIFATSVASAWSLADLSGGQSGGTEAYLIMTKRDFFHDLMKKSSQKQKMMVTTRIRARRGNKAAKFISDLSKITFQNETKTGLKLRSRFQRLRRFHH